MKIRTKLVCGRNLYYPVCHKAKALAKTLGTASIPEKYLDLLRKEFKVEIIQVC